MKEYETNKVYICGNSEEEIFFIKSISLSYSNGHHIAFSDDNANLWKSKFDKYFYKDKKGISRYAIMGGNIIKGKNIFYNYQLILTKKNLIYSSIQIYLTPP
jgi:hypothetical protein